MTASHKHHLGSLLLSAKELKGCTNAMTPSAYGWTLLYIAIMVVAFSSAYLRTNFNHRRHLYNQVAAATASARLPYISSPYAFLDCGDYRKLEKFGDVICSRSCPAAYWKPGLDPKTWEKASVSYTGLSGNAGNWSGTMPFDWSISFRDNIYFNLNLSDLGQIGVFPEQAVNWEWMEGLLMGKHVETQDTEINVLNGFAYTGGSTMAALKSAATPVKVTHLDASKSAVQWAKQNIEKSGLENDQKQVRWIVDDCITFLNREMKRGNKYNGLIFDPPAFGRFNGKMWKIERDFPTLIKLIPKLLISSNAPKFVILSCHDEKFPKERIEAMLRDSLRSFGVSGGKFKNFDMILNAVDIGDNGETELTKPEPKGKDLSCGSCVRWTKDI